MAGYKPDWQGMEEEDGEPEIDETEYKAQKDAIILAIEVSPSMLEQPWQSDSKKTDRDSPVRAALKCAQLLMEQRIISNPKDKMGILLFGTQKAKLRVHDGSRAGMGYPNCYLLTDLTVPVAEDVKALKLLVEDGEYVDEAFKPAKETVSLSNVLFCANQVFTTQAANFGIRRLFIITDNDDPCPLDKAAASAAAVRAKDLYDLGVTINLFPITRENSTFDVTKFYNDIVYGDPTADEGSSVAPSSTFKDGLTLLGSLISSINSRQTPKRAVFSGVPFEIAPGLRISIKGYNILHRQTPARTCYVWLDGDKPQIATGETTRIDEDSTRTVEKSEVKKAHKFGGDFVYFSPEESKALRDFGPPVVRIIGFKPRSYLPMWASVKKATFVFPNEEDYVGSTRVFTALWKKLLQDDKVGIAWCILRTNAQPILAALVPSKTPHDESSGTPYLPSGLWICPLPFADDMRESQPPANACKSSDELKTRMRVVVQQLQLPRAVYNPTKYPNPALQWHYRILKALALEEEVPEKADDATQPRYRAISKRAGGYLAEWFRQLERESRLASGSRALKREADNVVLDRPAKQIKAQQDGAAANAMTTAQIRTAVESGAIAKLTVAQLRSIADARGLDTSGRKMELVERIEGWFENI